ncbi:MAG TPA: bifunctional (p)ppGpp synthetase/guanosine-3',5'-bis(diphosphate) 3'-pyrophosphohydrolase [Steroidobacteraceae bacterium]|nr:bifunctional (p)ppGpp synthetase/guanosine-3',5'-bis(diphosphate) 3'-pyrophosphohydrolase [Steroidobacteraceae bacterium]
METIQLCPPAIRESIALARTAIEAATLIPHDRLALGAEAAEVMGALTDDPVLAAAVLAKPAVGLPGITPEKLARLVGSPVADIALALVRLGELGLPRDWSPVQGLDSRQAETLRKMLLAVVSDPRLVLARLAEQLVELRHARELPAEERERLAVEARAVFAPLANRLGVWQLKWELEDLAFRYLDSDEYRHIAAVLNERRADRERYIEELCASLQTELRKAGITAEVYGRPKHMYSIYRKMQRKQLAFDQLFDVRAVRVVVSSVPECYAALGVVHGLWQYIPGEFDDYIATPKGNFYRSIHTAVIGPGGKSVEVQIRTREMHEHAELGVAAHWTYKEGGARNSQYERKIEWVRKLLEPQDTSTDQSDRDFLERMRTELFEDRVYALTPKGEVIDLPRGATPLDFAYQIHTSLGHRCKGAKVNGRIVPLTYRLKNGEVVEIIAGKQEAPSRDWLAPEQGYLGSPHSRTKVRAWFRKQEAEQPDHAATQPVVEPPRPDKPITRPRARKAVSASPVEIEGVGDLPTTLARCCAPLRPQSIAGYVTLGRGVTIHRSECPSLTRMRALKPERVLQVEWTSDAGEGLVVEISVNALDRRGLVRDVTDVLALERLSIEAMTTTTDREAGTAHVLVTVSVTDLEQLARVLRRLGSVPNVTHARRVH